jgi:hypothetical protein
MDTHILNGDALANKFGLPGRQIVFRECLIDGPSSSDSLQEFWKQRSKYIYETFSSATDEYKNKVIGELKKVHDVEPGSDLNLWFEHDLFCQVNLWFALYYISYSQINCHLYIVYPTASDWCGFGRLTTDQLTDCFKARLNVDDESLNLALQLWNAYRRHELNKIAELSQTRSHCFPRLKDLCNAHLERYPLKGIGRPVYRLKEILAEGITDFNVLFKRFNDTEAIYGFGDLQVKRMLSELDRSFH